MFCMDVFLHKLVYEGIKRSEWKNFLREGEDMKKFGKKIAGFLLAAVLAVTAAFPAFAASNACPTENTNVQLVRIPFSVKYLIALIPSAMQGTLTTICGLSAASSSPSRIIPS